MKFLYAAIFVLATVAVKAQTVIPISSFMGLKFGTAPEEAIQQMSSTGAIYDAVQSKKETYIFKNGSYGSLRSDHVYFRYTGKRMYEGGAYFTGKRERMLSLFNDVKRLIAVAYGEGRDTRRFTGDFNDGDGRELESIENGYGSISTTWVEDPQRDLKNSIVLSIEPDLSVLLKFIEAKPSKK